MSRRRRPSWTDRILYKVNAIDMYDDIQLNIKQHTYKSHPTYSVSDHKPVTAEFDITVKITLIFFIILSRYSTIQMEILCSDKT